MISASTQSQTRDVWQRESPIVRESLNLVSQNYSKSSKMQSEKVTDSCHLLVYIYI